MQISYSILVDDVLFGHKTTTVYSRVLAFQDRVVRVAISDSKHIEHVAEFEEGVKPIENNNRVEERHAARLRGAVKR